VLGSVHENSWQKGTKAWNIGLIGQFSDWHSLSAQWNYIHRIKQFYNQNSSDIVVDLMDIAIRHEPRKLPWRLESTLKIESQQTVKKEWRYYYVGEGLGDYVYDSTYADYVSDVQGDYILRIVPSSIKQPVTSIEDGFRFQFDGGNLKQPLLRSILKDISALTDFRLQQEISELDGIFGYLSTALDRVDTNWANYHRTFQQDLTLRLTEIRSDLRLRYYNSDLVSGMDVRGLEETNADEWTLRYRGRFWGRPPLSSNPP
jgi:hypothetical protein